MKKIVGFVVGGIVLWIVIANWGLIWRVVLAIALFWSLRLGFIAVGLARKRV